MTKLMEPPTIYSGPLKTWTTEEYHALIEAGIFTNDHQFELIGGQITKMFPVGRAHNNTVTLLTEHFVTLKIKTSATFIVGVQNSITLLDNTEPQPDLYIALGPVTRYDKANPGGEDLLLVIEVAESSLMPDRTTKMVRYAAAGIPEYWIINVLERQIERYTEADTDQGFYRDLEIYKELDSFDSIHLGKFSVKELMVQYE